MVHKEFLRLSAVFIIILIIDVHTLFYFYRYLAGVASLTMIPVDLESARYHLEKASSMLQTTKKKAREQGEVLTNTISKTSNVLIKSIRNKVKLCEFLSIYTIRIFALMNKKRL